MLLPLIIIIMLGIIMFLIGGWGGLLIYLAIACLISLIVEVILES